MRKKGIRSWARHCRIVPLMLISICSLMVLSYPSVLGFSADNVTKYINEYPISTPYAAPLAITIDRSGMVWFTESNVSKIAQFDPNSKVFYEYSVPGIGDMWGIAADPNGYVWITQYSGKGSVSPRGAVVQGGAGSIVRFNVKTKNFTSIPIPTLGSFPLRLTLDLQGRVWFTELLANKIGVYDPSSNSLQEYPVPTNSSGPADLTFDTTGLLWFSESYTRQVGRFNPQSHSFTEYKLGAETGSQIVSSPVGIAVDNAHHIWLADHGGNWIVEFNPITPATMKYPTHFPPKEVYSIALVNDLLIDNNGRVWFCEHGGNSIGYYAPSVKRMVEYRIPTGPISTAMWLALAPNGDVWFTEWSSNKIGVVDANLLVPVSVNIPQDHIELSAGEKRTFSFAVSSIQPTKGNGTITYSWSSYNPREISISFTPTYPALSSEDQVQAQLTTANRLNPGNYTLALELDLGDVIVSSMVETVITSTRIPTHPPITTEVALWTGLIVIIAIMGVIGIRRIRQSAHRTKSRSSK